MFDLLRIQLRGERTGLIGWGLGLFLFTLAIGTSYAAIAEDAEAFDAAFASFEGVEEALGVDSFTSPDGYLKGQAVALFPLLLGISGGLAATKVLAGAQESGRLDHTLSRPLTRLRYLASASGSLVLGQLAIVFVAGLGAVIGYALSDLPGRILGNSFLMVLEVLPIALAHLAIGILAAVFLNRRGPANALVVTVVVGGFAVDLLGKLVDSLDWLQYVTLYGWWGRSDWFNGHVDPIYLVGSMLVILAAFSGAVLEFDRKDL
jgi:ABC-2 type transport system permease protein